MHSPGLEHFDVVFRTLRYVKGTSGRCLLFENKGHLHVEVFTDAD